jgi:hypothetical protein
MRLEKFNADKHYSIILDWWKKHDWQPVPPEALSTTGFMAYKDEIPLATGFLYDTDSAFSILEWIVGNPDIDHELRGEGLDTVIKGLLLVSDARGKKYVHTIVEHKRLIERYEKFQFQKTDTNMTVMIRSL